MSLYSHADVIQYISHIMRLEIICENSWFNVIELLYDLHYHSTWKRSNNVKQKDE